MKSIKTSQSQSVREIISSWRWRITKAGLKIKEFCALIDLKPGQMSGYLGGDVTPSIDTFEKIEGKLKELGV